MRTDYTNYEEPISTDDAPLYVEQYEREHMDWQYKSTGEQLFFGDESNYLDSEFSNELENEDQGNLDDADYDDALDEDPADEEDDDPYEDFEEEEEADEEDFDDEDLNDEDLNDEDLE